MSGSRRPLYFLGLALAAVALLQAIPYGRDHANPPVGATPAWDSPRTQELARRACFDCHSNETRWPWYSSIAPLSWRIQTHVNEGRKALNFSAFDPANEKMAEEAGEAGETITKGTMPPNDYLLAHPAARLNAEEKRALVAGLNATFGAGGAEKAANEAPGSGREHDEGHEGHDHD